MSTVRITGARLEPNDIDGFVVPASPEPASGTSAHRLTSEGLGLVAVLLGRGFDEVEAHDVVERVERAAERRTMGVVTMRSCSDSSSGLSLSASSQAPR